MFRGETMPQSYSKEDFAKMQQQAINRVREMQRQSRMNGQEESKPLPDAPAAAEAQQDKKAVPPQKSRTETNEKPVQKREEPPKRADAPPPPPIKRVYAKSRPNVSPFFEMDSDVALILPLLLLLQRDGADEMLILALLYIMS